MSAACALCCWVRCCKAFALLMFLFTDGMASLYIISGMFGLFQGGIVPSMRLSCANISRRRKPAPALALE